MEDAALKSIDLSQFYWIVGALIIMNLGAIGSMILAAFKVVWFIAQLDSRIKQNTKDVGNAHSKIREVETRINATH